MSTIGSIRSLAAAVRGRRLELGLSQADLARRARTSRQWVNEFEGGKRTAELGLVLRLLDALGLQLEITAHEPSAATESVDLDGLLDDYQAP